MQDTTYQLPNLTQTQTTAVPTAASLPSIPSITGGIPKATTPPPEATVPEDFNAQIASLQSQVANLEKRLSEVDAGEKVDSRNWFEKLTNLPEGQKWWMDIFDIIDRPLQALKWGISEGSLSEAWAGFSGQKANFMQEGYMSGSQFLQNIGVLKDIENLGSTQRFLIDLGVDIFADPLTYIAPVKLLKKLGILSDTKVATKFDDFVKAARKDGLITQSKKIVDDALGAARRSADDILKGADNIDDLLVKNFDELTDLQKKAVKKYKKTLSDAGVLFEDDFVKLTKKYGQFVDETGRVRGFATVDDAADYLANSRKALDEAVVAKNAAVKANKDAQKALRAARANANVLPTEFLDELQKVADAAREKQKLAVETLRDAGRKYDRAKSAVNEFNDFMNSRTKAEAGAAAERRAAEEIRQGLQAQTDEIFENVDAVAGNVKSNAADIEFYYRTSDGYRVKLQKTLKNGERVPFKFEIKDLAKPGGGAGRFRLGNTNFGVYTGAEVANLKSQLDDLIKLGKEGTEEAKRIKQRLDRILKIAGELDESDIVIRLDASNAFYKKFGTAGEEMMNSLFNDLIKVTNANGLNFGEGLRMYRELATEAANQGTTFQKYMSNAAADDIVDFLKTKGFVEENITKFMKSKSSINISKDALSAVSFEEILKMDFLRNTDDAFGIWRWVIDDAGNKIKQFSMMTPDEFFQRLTMDSITVRANRGSSILERYFKVNFGEVVDSTGKTVLGEYSQKTAKELMFFEKLLDTPEQIGKRMVTETTVRKGLAIRALNKLGDSRLPFIAPAAKALEGLADSIGTLFNASKGLDPELVEQVARISAEGQQAAKFTINRVNEITNRVVKATKGRFTEKQVREALQFILESGWDGVSVSGRRVSAKAFGQRIVTQFSRKGSVALPEMSTLAFRNFSDNLATFFRGQGMADDFFTLTQKGGYTLLEFKSGTTVKELTELFENLAPRIADDTMFDFGKAILSETDLTIAREFGEEIAEIAGHQKKLQQLLVDELGFDAFPDDILGTGAYFRHAINPEMLNIMKRKSPASLKKFLDAGTDQLRDRTYIGSVREINQSIKDMFNIKVDIFNTDVAYGFADLVRVTMTKREMGLVLKEMIQTQQSLGKGLFEVVDNSEAAARNLRRNFQILDYSFQREFSNLYKNISGEAQKVLDDFFAELGYAQGSKVIAIQNGAYNILKRIDNAYVNLPEFVKTLDDFTKFWKSFTLVTPGYHTRNFFGNITNSYLAGMGIPQQIKYLSGSTKDFSYYHRVSKALARGEDITKLPKRVQEGFRRVDDYFQSGIAQSHIGVKDLEVIKEGIEKAKGTSRGLGERLLNGVVNVNYKVAESMDDLQRYALYRWSFDSATSSSVYRKAKKAGAAAGSLEQIQRSQAYRKVAEALFDYGHLTPFEKEYMKRLFPFYTFFKNNLIFQAQNLLKRPERYGRFYRAYNYYIEDLTSLEIQDIPDYMTDNLWLPMPMTVKRGDEETITFLKLNLPPSDFTDFIENPFARGVNTLTVPVKLPIELGIGRDLFTGRQLKDFPGQLTQYDQPGLLQGMRTETGQFSLSQDPIMVKVLNDLGMRTFFNYTTLLLDILDYTSGSTDQENTRTRILNSLGITSTQELDKLTQAGLYQQIDKLNDLRDLYEQEYGSLPTLDEIEQMSEAILEEPVGLPSIPSIFG